MDYTEIGLQLREFFTHFITFILFFWIMKKFAWGPVTRILSERQQGIEKGFRDIKQKQTEAESLYKDYLAKLQNAEQEGRARIQEAIAEGRRVSAELTEHAREEAARITDRAQRNIQLEVDKARIELRDEIVMMTLGATERLMRTKLDETAHRQLVENFVQDIESEISA